MRGFEVAVPGLQREKVSKSLYDDNNVKGLGRLLKLEYNLIVCSLIFYFILRIFCIRKIKIIYL